MSILNFIQSSLGIPFEGMSDLAAEQDSTYWTGNGLGWLPEEVVAKILQDATETTLTGSPATGFKQRFEALDYVVTDFWRGEIYGIVQARQGRFEFELTPPPNYEMRINIPWKLDILSGVTMTQDDIIILANQSIKDYWTQSPLGNLELVSRNDGLRVPVTVNIVSVPSSQDFAWNVKVYPDSAATVEHYEAVWMADFSWSMRETFSFRPREDEPQKAGRGPHEVGHMMGIPHDVGDRFTVMSTIDQVGFNHWRFSLGGDANPVLRPYAAHFKLAKVWADMVFTQFERIEDFFVSMP